MEFTIDAKLFTAALTDAKRYIKGNRIPVLTCCKLTVDDGACSLTVTDLESAMVLQLQVAAAVNGVAVVPVSELATAIKGIKGNVTLQTSGGECLPLPDGTMETDCEKHGHSPRAVIIRKTQDSYFSGVTIPCECSADSFPDIPIASTCATWYELPAAPLVELIGRTSFAISKQPSRFTLNGARMELNPDGIRLIATDGHRMAVADYPKWSAHQQLTTMVSAFTLSELARVKSAAVWFCEGVTDSDLASYHNRLAECTTDAERKRIEGSAPTIYQWFTCGARALVSRKLTGNFPDYQRAMPRPDSVPNSLTIDRATLLQVADRALTLQKKDRMPTLRFALNGVIHLEAGGESKFSATIPGEYVGSELLAAVSPAYLADWLKSSDSAYVAMRFSDNSATSKCVPNAILCSDANSTYVLMPQRV